MVIQKVVYDKGERKKPLTFEDVPNYTFFLAEELYGTDICWYYKTKGSICSKIGYGQERDFHKDTPVEDIPEVVHLGV